MNQQQHPQPQPQPQQPGWNGQQPAWGTPQPGYGQPQFLPQPPKKSNTGKIIGFSCLGVIALFVLLGIIGLVATSGGSDDTTGTRTPASIAAETPEKSEAPSKAKPAPAAPVKITAKKTAFSKSILADGSNYTSVLVTVANNSSKEIDVNPLYFTITDANGTKHTAELAADEKQIDTVKLAPGENISGTITGKGAFTAKYVTYTDGIFGDSVRADVS